MTRLPALYISDDGSTCTLCNQKLDLHFRTCLCCGQGHVHTCWKYPKCKGWAIGDNRGCDTHPKRGDRKAPKEFPDCIHKIERNKRLGLL